MPVQKYRSGSVLIPLLVLGGALVGALLVMGGHYFSSYPTYNKPVSGPTIDKVNLVNGQVVVTTNSAWDVQVKDNVCPIANTWIDKVFFNLCSLKEIVWPYKSEEIKKNVSDISTSTDPLAPSIVEGKTLYPADKVSLWGYDFYTSQIPSKNVDIGSKKKQNIATILNDIKYPVNLSKKLLIIFVDPPYVKSTDYVSIPWLSNTGMPVSQAKVGEFFSVSGGGIIVINSTYDNFRSVLIHELGHFIGEQLTDSDWKQFYLLRDIPANTPLFIDEWAKSPGEDFAEIYKHYWTGENIGTFYRTSKEAPPCKKISGICLPEINNLSFDTSPDYSKVDAFLKEILRNIK